MIAFSTGSRLGLVMFLLLANFALAQEIPELFMLDGEFKTYLERSEGADLERRIELWMSLVESPNRELYRAFVWQQKGPDSEKRMMVYRRESLQRQEKLVPRMLAPYEEFPSTLAREVHAFRRLFPDLRSDFQVYLFPSFGFNGKTGSFRGNQVLLFGVDVIAERDDHLGVLFLHELFHIYHEQVQAEPFDESKVSLTFPLWAEGLATRVTHLSYPDEDYLMDPELLRLNREYVPVLAERFLEVANMSTQSEGVGEVYRLWFKAGTPERVLPGLPNRPGYLLGDAVIAELNKSYSLDTMARWSPQEAHDYIILGLKRVAARD